MTHHRFIVMTCAVLLLWGLGWSRASAQGVPALQLCGFVDQFADLIFINAIPSDDDDPRFYATSGWVQTVPHLYRLIGPGGFVRGDLVASPIDLTVFQGAFLIVNTTEQFGSNPTCTVSVRLTNVSVPEFLLFVGPADFTCIGGPSGSFEGTLQVTVSTCRESGFPGGIASLEERMNPQMSMPGDLKDRPAFGSSPTGWRP